MASNVVQETSFSVEDVDTSTLPGEFIATDRFVEFRRSSATEDDLTSVHPWRTVVFWPISVSRNNGILFKFVEVFGEVVYFKFIPQRGDGCLVVVFRDLAGALTAIHSFRQFRRRLAFPRIQAAYIWKLYTDSFINWTHSREGTSNIRSQTVPFNYDESQVISRLRNLADVFRFEINYDANRSMFMNAIVELTFQTVLDAVIYTTCSPWNKSRRKVLNPNSLGQVEYDEPRIGFEIQCVFKSIRNHFRERPSTFSIAPRAREPRCPSVFLQVRDFVTILPIVIRKKNYPMVSFTFEVIMEFDFIHYLTERYVNGEDMPQQWVSYFYLGLYFFPNATRKLLEARIMMVNHYFTKMNGSFFTSDQMNFYFGYPHLTTCHVPRTRLDGSKALALEHEDDPASGIPVLSLMYEDKGKTKRHEPYFYEVPIVVHKSVDIQQSTASV